MEERRQKDHRRLIDDHDIEVCEHLWAQVQAGDRGSDNASLLDNRFLDVNELGIDCSDFLVEWHFLGVSGGNLNFRRSTINTGVALALWRQVEVRHADGARASFDPVDLIIASAGATHPLQSWLDALRPGGRLLLPMTAGQSGPGAMLLVTRLAKDRFAAGFLGDRVAFIDFKGARSQDMSRRLATALDRDWGAALKSLRRDGHTRDKTCWLHGKGWCLSRRRRRLQTIE
jgi:hypothetical protein